MHEYMTELQYRYSYIVRISCTLQIQRYNQLLNLIRYQLAELDKGIQGLVVMSSDLEDIFASLYDGRVPKPWAKVRFALLFCSFLPTSNYFIAPYEVRSLLVLVLNTGVRVDEAVGVVGARSRGPR